MNVFTNYLRKFSLLIPILIISTLKLSAQTVETGHEILRGEVNFTDLANYQLAHPPAHVEHELENDENENIHPVRPPADPALVRMAATPPATYGATFFSNSPAPADTFESTLDDNTSIPPDTHGGVDLNYCVTAVNQGVHIQTRAGANVSNVTLDGFWASVLPAGGTFDPRIYYDQTSGHWIIVTVAGANNTPTVTTVLLGVSETGDPTGSWYLYNIPAYTPGGYWLDFPDVGFNSKWITVTGNLFQDGTGTGYLGCKVFAFDKTTVLGGSSAPFTAFTQASSECIVPAITYDAAQQSLFAVEIYDGSMSQVRLWKIAGAVGAETMTTVSYPTTTALNKWQSSNNAYSGASQADFCPQAGSPDSIQANDDRITQVIFMNDSLWFAHNVFLPYSTTANALRVSVQWWEIDTTGMPIQVGRIDDMTGANYYDFPSIAVNKNNDALLGFSHLSPTIHPTASYALHAHTDAAGSMEALVDFRHGLAPYYKVFGGTRDRWGDYSGTTIDPVNNIDFWTIQEASASPANTWDTWWASVKPCNLPTATVTASGPTTICSDASVTLSSSTGAGYTYQWQSGSGAIAGATNSTYTTSTAGSYSVVITVVTCVTTSAATTVSVNATPSATVTASGPTGLCAGGSVTLNAPSVAGYTYQWQLGGGPIPGATTSSYTASTAGNYTVLVTNPVGSCSATSAITAVTVGSGPGAAVTTSGPTTFCSGGSVTLSTTSATGLTYQWQLGGATIPGATGATYEVTATGGNYTVVVTNTAGGCSSTSGITTVTITSGPGATITPAGPTTFCSPGSVVLNATTGAGITYQWQVGGVNIPGAVASSYTASASGNYAVIVTQGPCVVTSAPVTVTVITGALPTLTGPDTVCIGGTITLTDAIPGGAWSSSNTGIATVSASGIVGGIAAGAAGIAYTATTSCGTFTATDEITVSPLQTPSVSIAASPAGAICTGHSVIFTATPVYGGTAPTYTWTNGPTAVGAGATFTLTAPVTGDIIKCTMTSNFACLSSAVPVSSTNYIVTVETPSVNSVYVYVTDSVIIPGRIDTFVAEPTSGGSAPIFQWYINGVAVPGAISSMFITSSLTNGNVVTCTETSSDPCASPNSVTSRGITIVVSASGVQQVMSSGTKLTLQPNPNNGEFTIKGTLNNPADHKVSILVTDMLGQTVYEKTANATNGTLNEKITLGKSIANGTYVVSITSGEDQAVYHIVVEK